MLNKGNLYKSNLEKYDDNYIPLNEYPRPNLVRKDYLILNGFWDFEISKKDVLIDKFTQKILVPYSVESPLSFINKLVEPDDYLIYHKKITLSSKFKDKTIIIHFNGVDQLAKVYINKKLVKEHLGIAKFDIQIPFLKEFDLDVIVNDKTDLSYLARGKQSLNPKNWIYSSSSGIIKTVWLELVDKEHIESIDYIGDFDNKSVSVKINSNVNKIALLKLENQTYKVETNKLVNIKLKKFHPWSNLDPYLYQVEVSLEKDLVKSYFGIRKIETKTFKGKTRVFLNNNLLFINGLLDQGYYFNGDLTPSSYKNYYDEISKIKELGFNCLRVHAKIEEDVFYYYADKLGVLLIQDFINGGYRYNFLHTVLPRFFPSKNYKNINERKTGRGDDKSRNSFYDEVNFYINNYKNNPSVIIYTIFNENWGEFRPNELYDYCKKLDPTRLYDTASGWLDAKSDFYSIHTYSIPDMKRIDKQNRAFIISECGGLGLKIKDNSLFDGMFAHKNSKNKIELEEKYKFLFLNQLKPQIIKYGLNGIIYTQLSDCESEYNGLFTFDRKILKIDEKLIIQINALLEQEFNKLKI